MSSFHLPLFGAIAPGGFYEASTIIADRPLTVRANFEETGELDHAVIVALTAFLSALEERVRAARQAITAGFAEDEDSASVYIRHHLATMLIDAPATATPEQLARHLFPECVWLSAVAEEPAIIDFTVGKQYTDCVLKVSFDATGSVTCITMES